LQDVLDAATGAYGEKVAIDLGATFVEDTDFNSWPLSADVLSFLAQANKAAMLATGLGGGASGVAAFQAADRYNFLGNSGLRYGPVTVGIGAAVSFPLRQSGGRHIVMVNGSGGAFGIVLVRALSGGLAADAVASFSNFTAQTGALTGSTGPNGNINFGVSAGLGYLENRGAYPNPLQAVIFEG